MEHLLEVKELETSLLINKQWFPTIDKVSFKLDKGEVLGIVGESGCGKSILNKSIIKLLPEKISKITNGEVLFEGKRIDKYSEKEFLNIRGNDIGMIFQEPMTALNPVFKIKNQIIESILVHQKKSKKEAYKEAKELLLKVGISRQDEVLNSYPHQLSGGMRQRVMIAMAICCSPKLLIADEPTTALDVTIQAQILDLLKNIQNDTQMSIILITHDLSVVKHISDIIGVMYLGNMVEIASHEEIYTKPLHPYTQALISSIPQFNQEKKNRVILKGELPSPSNPPSGCPFQTRCPLVRDKCRREKPKLKEIIKDHQVACFYPNHVGSVANV